MSKIEHEALEELLRHSEPRPVPAPDGVTEAKNAVREEWRAVSRRRIVRQRLSYAAIAASLVVGALVVLNVMRVPTALPVQVASIEKTLGPVYVLGEQSQLRPTDGISAVYSGQVVVTSSRASLALAWGNGGSLRVDENSRVRFTDGQSVFLESGRMYFDSVRALVAGVDPGGAPELTLETSQGAVRHLGTQFMVEVDADRLVVSVREGEVLVDGTYYEQRVVSGQQATLRGAEQPSVLAISRFGDHWDWVVRATPVADVDGRSLSEFLAWVGRELGLAIEFEGGAEAIAREAILKGTINTRPEDALRLRLATAALQWRIEEGVIYISE